MQITSWGGIRGNVTSLARPAFSTAIRDEILAGRSADDSRVLVVGNLRSYGDEVIGACGRYIQTTRCDRILKIDTLEDTVTAECGVRLDVLQERLTPVGLCIPVTPGTAFLTIGGAIANDVHGKNHHVAGTFGCFVQRFELVRSTGEVLLCSRQENTDLFAATIGGMGLTGAITWATLRLRRLRSPLLRVESTRFANLDEFFVLDAVNKDRHEYSVAWIDCLAGGSSLGRGIYSSADHVAEPPHEHLDAAHPQTRVTIPFSLPISPINSVTLRAMNALYWRSQKVGIRQVPLTSWMYPLDSVDRWNKLYGSAGFYQFQCVIPLDHARSAVTEMLRTIAAFRQGSFLAVLKNFGAIASPGLMSFPMPGTTLALDFPNRGRPTRELLMELHRITAAAFGRLYPAKDGCSPSNSLEIGYANVDRFKRLMDPGFGSIMARRLQLIA